MKLYIESSVPNFLFADDAPEKKDITKRFFDDETGKHDVFISQLVLEELKQAPPEKSKKLHEKLPKHIFRILDVTDESKELADRYVQSGIIPSRFKNDALHIAVAVVNKIDVIVSWNLKHIVKVKTIIGVNEINKKLGYKEILINTPEEVLE